MKTERVSAEFSKEMKEQQAIATSPEARAGRLKKLRNLANLSRKNLAEKAGINFNTYVSQESAKFGGLSTASAKKVIPALIAEGVNCTYEWLMFDTGKGPSFHADFNEANTTYRKYLADFIPPDESEADAIVKEILFFHQNHPMGIDLIVEDDGMAPHYKPGDYIAGIRRFEKNIFSLIGLECILQTKSGEILFRKLYKAKDTPYYTLRCLNPDTEVARPTLYEVELISAAPVIWHRRKDPAF